MTQLNDSLEALFAGDTGPVRTAPVRENAVEFKSAEQRFEETCQKCRGTGNYRNFGRCFACKGVGKFTFKTSPEARAQKQVQTAARKDRAQQDVWSAFAAQNHQIAEWIIANRARFDFAAKMNETVIRFGDLTTGQRDAIQRMIDREVAKAAQRAESVQSAPMVDTAGVDRLKDAFDKAKAYAAEKGLSMRTPKITIGGMVISPAKATSANAGALYVKQAGEYLGKIVNGRFLSISACTPAQREQVLAFVADPQQAAKAYGQTTGVCCICNATLTSKWKFRGIGPICADKMGWSGLAEAVGVKV